MSKKNNFGSAIAQLFNKDNRIEAANAFAITYGATIRHLCFHLSLKLQELGRFDEAEIVAQIALDKRNAVIK